MFIFYSNGQVDAVNSFKQMFIKLSEELLEQEPFNVGEWQSIKLDNVPQMKMREVINVHLSMELPENPLLLSNELGAHMPWAEDHFLERVSGKPLNPPPSNEWWPFAQQGNKEHKSEGEAFSHTYPERMWPKYSMPLNTPQEKRQGIRFDYGDLDDVVRLLRAQPNTRQAYLPIWFPEDTGVVHGKRVPCTLGYHFMIRGGKVNITYFMRSCDLLRHLQDDIYMAGRLAQWMVYRLNFSNDGRARKHPYEVGTLNMHIVNLHVFEGDTAMMEYRLSRGEAWSE